MLDGFTVQAYRAGWERWTLQSLVLRNTVIVAYEEISVSNVDYNKSFSSMHIMPRIEVN